MCRLAQRGNGSKQERRDTRDFYTVERDHGT
jgi:hypothetical protein